MNFTKPLLISVAVAGITTSVFSADTLADAFKNGAINGTLKAYYFDRTGTDAPGLSGSVFSVGVALNYETESLNGWQADFGFQSSVIPYDDNGYNTFYYDEYSKGAQLSTAYLKYTYNKTVVKIGRQQFFTPVVNTNPSRFVQESFEAATISNEDLIPDTKIFAAVLTSVQTWTDGHGHIGTFTSLDNVGGNDTLDNPAYTVYVDNYSIPNLRLQAQWAAIKTNDAVYAGGDMNLYYAEADYDIVNGDMRYGIAFNTEYKTATLKSDGFMYGAKASFGIENFNSFIAYSVITDHGDMMGVNPLSGGISGGPQTLFAIAAQDKAGDYNADTKAYSIDANYKFPVFGGTLIGVRYTHVDDGTTNEKYVYENIYSRWNLSGITKGLTSEVGYEEWRKDQDAHELWAKLIYSF